MKKIAILGSSLFGTISGNVVSNVMTVGVVTIPLMIRVGYRQDKGQFLLALDEQFERVNTITVRLSREPQFAPNGDEWVEVWRLMSVFERINVMVEDGILDVALVDRLYGVRLVIKNQPMWHLGAYHPIVFRLTVGLGFLVPIPAFLFFRTLKLLNKTGAVLILWVTPVLVALSIVTLTLGPRGLLSDLNSLVVAISLAIFVVELLLDRSKSPDTRLIQRGLMPFIACALYENLTDFLPLRISDSCERRVFKKYICRLNDQRCMSS